MPHLNRNRIIFSVEFCASGKNLKLEHLNSMTIVCRKWLQSAPCPTGTANNFKPEPKRKKQQDKLKEPVDNLFFYDSYFGVHSIYPQNRIMSFLLPFLFFMQIAHYERQTYREWRYEIPAKMNSTQCEWFVFYQLICVL